MQVRAAKKAEFTLREATEEDLDALAEQRNSMYRDMNPDLAFDPADHATRYKAWARKLMRRKKLIPFLVTDSAGNPVAGGTVWIRENQPSPRYPVTEMPYLMSMYTDPAYRRKGLATMIVKHAIKLARARGYPRLVLHASEMGEPVYARLGFQRTTEMRLALDPRGKPTQERHR